MSGPADVSDVARVETRAAMAANAVLPRHDPDTEPMFAALAGPADVRTILAIDPGTTRSAWVVLRGDRPVRFGIEPNGELIERLRGWHDAARVNEVPFLRAVVIEQVVSYGMAIGRETIETIHWAGRFAEAAYPTSVYRIPRKTVCMSVCGSARAKDPNVRAALLDRFGGASAIGRKAHPGPLYGFKADLFAALGVAVCWSDMEPEDRAEKRLP